MLRIGISPPLGLRQQRIFGKQVTCHENVLKVYMLFFMCYPFLI